MQNPLKSLWQGRMCRDDGTSWQGVLCYYNRVAAVNLDGMNLTGEATESAIRALLRPAHYCWLWIYYAHSLWHVGTSTYCLMQGHCQPALQT